MPDPKNLPPPISRDPLAVTALLALVIVGIITGIDLLQDGRIDAQVAALFIGAFGPIVPALIIRYRNGTSS